MLLWDKFLTTFGVPHQDILQCKFYLCFSLFWLTFNLTGIFSFWYEHFISSSCVYILDCFNCAEKVYLKYLSSHWHNLLSVVVKRFLMVLAKIRLIFFLDAHMKLFSIFNKNDDTVSWFLFIAQCLHRIVDSSASQAAFPARSWGYSRS